MKRKCRGAPTKVERERFPHERSEEDKRAFGFRVGSPGIPDIARAAPPWRLNIRGPFGYTFPRPP